MPRLVPGREQKVSKAKELREAGESYMTIAREVGVSWSTARDWTLDVRPDLARSAEDTETLRRARARATQAIADVVNRGSCGTAGCRIAGCSIPFGSCHCGCGEPAPLAVQSDRKQSYVKGEPHLFVVGHNSILAARRADGRISSSAFVEKHGRPYGLDRLALREAIDEGWLPGEKVNGAGVDPNGHVYLVNAAELIAALDAKPRCRFETCELPAWRPSGACGRHAGPLTKRGSWWETDEAQEVAALLSDPEDREDFLRGRCWLCGRQALPKPLCHVARAWRERRRRVCVTCASLWLPALWQVRGHMLQADTNLEAVERAWKVADRFERELRRAQPGRRGQPRHIALDLVIEALLIGRKLSNAEVAQALNRAIVKGLIPRDRIAARAVSREYVKTRQRRAKIVKRAVVSAEY